MKTSVETNMEAGIYWLTSFPKSGNTWTRSFIANLLENAGSPIDINEFHTGSISSARGWMDEALGFDTAELSHDEIDLLRPAFYRWISQEMTEDGHHKCHDAYTFLPDGTPLFPKDVCKGVLYIMRNPLDVAISYANHSNVDIDRSIKKMANPNAAFCQHIKGQANQLRQKLLDWSGHVLSWVDEPGLNLKVVRYEDMRLNGLETFTGVAKFLQLPHDKKSVQQALINCDFALLQKQEQQGNFKERPAKAKCFFRKGVAGDWKETLTTVQVQKIIADHGEVMRRFGYLDADNQPLHPPAEMLHAGVAAGGR